MGVSWLFLFDLFKLRSWSDHAGGAFSDSKPFWGIDPNQLMINGYEVLLRGYIQSIVNVCNCCCCIFF